MAKDDGVEDNTAAAYLGIAHLFNERWAEAGAGFRKIIDPGLYDLVEAYRDSGSTRATSR